MNWKIITIALSLLALIFFLFFKTSSNTTSSELFVQPQFGNFQIDIVTTGELEAKSSVDVSGPTGLRAAQIYNINIDDIVPEGSLVKKAEYIARLDNSQLVEKVKNKQNDLEQSLSEYTQTKLDTALELRQARDEIVNLEYAVEEKKLVLDQSTYEPPATVKQASIDLEKSKRELTQAISNYRLKSEKAVAQMQEAAAELADDQNSLDFLDNIMKQLVITAPESGMVIYARDWNGKKRTAGSQISTWSPIVATLPDLTTMVSKTYVNEVDIRKVKSGQSVEIGLDAFPDKKLTGTVINVANVGEQKPNSDSKVFEVTIELRESDTTLRPSMTTSNTIIASVLTDAVYVPLECLFTQGDSITYVVKKTGLGVSKQQVMTGPANENEIVIEKGVSPEDQLLLSYPPGIEEKDIMLLTELSQP
ncbi:MAG: secretion protein HlyD [Cyclobacteriaceae bacterium]|nr:MAG: secretion protein HlyD [Cyclobacteriaceae bacterium]